MLKVLVFGGSGLVGSRVKDLLGVKYQIIAPSHLEVDVADKIQIEQILERLRPNYIIYAAGLTSIDKAEDDSKLAYQLNSYAPATIASVAASIDAPVLYFSTDAVFDGTKSDRPYTENDRTNPLSKYGKSKLLGEQLVMEASKKNCIARIIMVYSYMSSKRKRFLELVIDTLKKGEKFYGITNQMVNPIYVDDVAAAVKQLIERKCFGIYHLGAKDYVSNYDFIKKIAITFNLDQSLVEEITYEEFSKLKKVPRNKFCWLDTSKFKKMVSENILHSVDEGLRLCKKNSGC